jgi:amino acid permease-like protein
METAAQADARATGYGLRREVLSPMETLAQSVSTIAPTTTPAATIPLVCALAGNGTWLAYVLATAAVLLVALCISRFARYSASPGSLYTYSTTILPPWLGATVAWSLLLAYVATGSSVIGGFYHYANLLLQDASGHAASTVILSLVVTAISMYIAWRAVKISARLMLWIEAASVSLILIVVVLVLARHGLHPDWTQLLAPSGCNPTLSPAACAYTSTCNASGATTGCGFMGLPDGTTIIATYEGGNIDLRVPYIGYSSESESYTAAGISAYNALQAHVEKRLSHGLQVGFSYTFSHATDEQSAMGLFYNGNNPSNLRSGYGLSDFDRKHVLNFTYLYELPKFYELNSLRGRLVDGWAIAGLGIIQSGQPYSIVDYSGAVGSVFFGTSDGITNPIVPLTSNCSPSGALTGASGTVPGVPALNPNCFTLPLLNPGDLGGAIPAGDTYETTFTTGQRNVFRQPWQRRTDASLIKSTQLTERFIMKFTFEVFNVTNTASFDIPIDNVSQNLAFNDFPVYGSTLYASPTLSGLGVVNKTIGSPRQIQMSLIFLF